MNVQAFGLLSPENQDKVLEIYRIALILKENHQQPLTVKDFDRHYDSSLSDLRKMTEVIRDRETIPG
jgi:hypothetical protein